MPKRTLDDSLLTSPSLAAVSPRCQDSFHRFILLADDFGCFGADARVVLGKGWPLRPDVTEQDVEGWMVELSRAGMLQIWEEGGRRFAFLTGWFGAHGQRNRGEYDPKKNPSGSRRKTPQPPPYVEPAASLPQARGVLAAVDDPPQNRGEPAANPPLRSQSQSQLRSQSQSQSGSDRCPAAGPPQNETAPPDPAVDLLAAFRSKLADELAIVSVNPLPVARSERAEAIRRHVERLGLEYAVEISAEHARDVGKVPKWLDWFLDFLSEQETPVDRSPGENPKAGDPDFNDPAAWRDYAEYLARTDGKTAEEALGFKPPKYVPPKTPEEEAEEEKRRAHR